MVYDRINWLTDYYSYLYLYVYYYSYFCLGILLFFFGYVEQDEVLFCLNLWRFIWYGFAAAAYLCSQFVVINPYLISHFCVFTFIYALGKLFC